MKNKYPIYIISKGRWNQRHTAKALESMNVNYYIVVEANEVNKYSQFIKSSQILTLPQEYLDNYDTFWPREPDNKTGPGAARNFCWEHSIATGHKRHWVLDDNIYKFHRLNKNKLHVVRTPAIFRATEDFIDRYENVKIAGFQYEMFVPMKTFDYPHKPFNINSRIYSTLLIENNTRHRWRGRYNEDTDLSIRVLKDGFCTIQINAFQQGKATTQKMDGGNTSEFYEKEGTAKKSQMLKDMHPEITNIVWRYNRVHHEVDYSVFKTNKLIYKKGINIPTGINNYGMILNSSIKP